MCFSATASFTASFSLSVLGIATLIQTTAKNQRLLAAFPLLFASQQLLEGIVWSTLDQHFSSLQSLGTYGFLGFATGLWLVLSPLAVYDLEENPFRKKLILGLMVIGASLGLYLVSFIVKQGVIPTDYSGNLLYDLNFIPFYEICKYLYLLVISLPFLISSQRVLIGFGSLVILSFILADRLYQVTFVSVWCFFAAILSSALFLIFYFWKTDSLKLKGKQASAVWQK